MEHADATRTQLRRIIETAQREYQSPAEFVWFEPYIEILAAMHEVPEGAAMSPHLRAFLKVTHGDMGRLYDLLCVSSPLQDSEEKRQYEHVVNRAIDYINNGAHVQCIKSQM